jgi:coenzyme F420-reducing hydrogenase alpha subunit
VNRCVLCEQDKDEAMLLVQCASHKRQVCGTCAWAVAQSLAACRALERSYDNRNDPVRTALRQILDQQV